MTDTQPKTPAPAEPVEQAQGYDVFISYSRADRDRVVELVEGLEARGVRAWVDLEAIPPSAEWMGEIRAAIDGADGYLVVLSPDLARSQVCAEELEHAVGVGKRIVPVLVRATDPGSLPPSLAARNWIDATGRLEDALDQIVSALRTDLDHVKAHTRLGVLAGEWERKGEPKALLLRGAEIAQAEQVVASAAEPRATPTQARFVQASRAGATRRQRGLIGAAAGALVVAVALSAVALVQRGEAVEQRTEAERQAAVSLSRELSAASTAQLSVDPELSLLLGIEAAEGAPTVEAADALRDALIASRHVSTFRGHEDPILGASFSPDGTRVLTVSSFAKGYVPDDSHGDDTVRIWDTATGRQIAEIPTSGSALPVAEFSSDGDSVLVSDDDPPAIYDGRTGDLIKELDELASGEAHFGPTGELVVGSCPRGYCIVDADSGELDVTLERTPARFKGVTFTTDGASLAGFSDREGFIWDSATGVLTHSISTTFDIRWMSMASRGDQFLLAGSQEVGVWTVDGDEQVREWQTDADTASYRIPVEPAINADGSRVATMNGGGTISVWNTRTGGPVSVLPASSVRDVEFSPDGQRLLTVSEDHTATVWDAERGRAVVELLGSPGHLWLGRFSTDGSHVVTAGSDLTARLWVVDPGAPVRVFTARPGGDGQTATFTPDGSGLLTGGYAGLVRRWDVQTTRVLKTYKMGPSIDERYANWIWNAVPSPDGSQVAASTSRRSIVLWNAATGERTATLRFSAGEGPGAPGASSSLEGVTWAVTFSPDGRALASASQDGVARVWDPQDGSLIARLTEHDAAVNDVAFDPDGTKILTGSDDGTAKVWDVSSGRSLMTLHGQPQGVTAVAWSPNDSLLATTSYDGTVHLRDAETGRTMHVLTGSLGVVQTADFSPDSRWLATTSDEDGALRVWETVTGRLVDIHQGVLGSMGYAIDYSPDGEFIAVPGFTGAFGSGVPESLIYRCELCTDLGGLKALAEERVTRSLTPEERERFLHVP